MKKTTTKTLKFNRALLILAFGLMAGWTGEAALEATPGLSSISAGTGGARLAAVEASEVAFANPAALAYLKGYLFNSTFSQTPLVVEGGNNGSRDEMSLSLVDRMTETIVPTVLGYSAVHERTGPGDWYQRDLRIGVGNYFLQKHSLGFLLSYRTEREDVETGHQIGLSWGGLFSLTKNWSLGVVADQFVASRPSGFLRQPLRPGTGIGASYILDRKMRFKFDIKSAPNNSYDRPTLAGGIETFWSQFIIFRLGLARNNAEEASISSIGLGFSGPVFGLHYAFQQFEEPGPRDSRHSIDLNFPIW